MSDLKFKPCAVWTDDCQGKKDFDGRLVSISTRFWPSGGGFHVLRVFPQQEPTFELNENPAILPSATASIVLNHGEPDEYGYGNYLTLCEQNFENSDPAVVMAEVEKWVEERVNEIAVVLQAHFRAVRP